MGLFSVSASAEENTESLNIVETPDLKIVISGQESDYTDTPLIINSRTMLPLREVLTNLGVQNDDEHIIWDGETKSVTIVTEDKTIILQVGSYTAYINGEAMEMDVAPVLYAQNWRTYIPARFVSEALDKKVAWDGTNRAVIITSTESYNEVLDILTKCDEAMANITKFKFDMNYDILAVENGQEATVALNFTGEMDPDNDASHIDIDIIIASPDMGNIPISMTMEQYLVGETAYSTATVFGIDTGWTKEDAADQEKFVQEDIAGPIEANDIVASGLVIGESKDEDIIELKGNILIEKLVNYSLIEEMSEAEKEFTKISDYYVEIGINKDSYELAYFNLIFDINSTDENGQALSANITMYMNFIDYNGNFAIVVPQEVIDAAKATEVLESEMEIDQ
jgi:hypothetical protein